MGQITSVGDLVAENCGKEIAVTEVGWLPLYAPKLNVLIQPYVKGIVFSGQGFVIPDYGALEGKTS